MYDKYTLSIQSLAFSLSVQDAVKDHTCFSTAGFFSGISLKARSVKYLSFDYWFGFGQGIWLWG
jgi:hypothetical protein